MYNDRKLREVLAKLSPGDVRQLLSTPIAAGGGRVESTANAMARHCMRVAHDSRFSQKDQARALHLAQKCVALQTQDSTAEMRETA